MPNLRAIWDNRFFDAATLAASSQAAGLPVINVQDRLRKRVWRTTSLAGQYLVADLGGSGLEQRPPVTALVLINHNLTPDGEVTIESGDLMETHPAWADILGYGDLGYGGPGGYGGVFNAEERSFYVPDPLRIIYLNNEGGPLEARGEWQISFVDPANPDGYIEVGRIFLTYFDEYRYNFFPDSIGGEDDSEQVLSRGGQVWTDIMPVRRTLSLPFENLHDADKFWTLLFMVKKVGLSQDWVIDPVPDGVARRHFMALYGRFSEIPEVSRQFGLHSEFELNFIESL